MKAKFILILILFNPVFIKSQDTTSRERVQPRCWVYLNGDPQRISTRLFDVKDSSIVISTTSKLLDYYKGNYETREFDLKLIRSIKFMNSNHILAGMLLGAIPGLFVGVALGLNEKDSPPSFLGGGRSAESKAAEDIFYSVITGVGAGALLTGLIRINIPIDGKPENFARYKSRLQRESVKKKYLSNK